MTGLTIADKVTMPETAYHVSHEGSSSKKSKRTLYIVVAIVIGILVSAGIVLAGIYLGHTLTRASYQEAKLAYINTDGSIVHETVRIHDNEVDIESEKDFSVIFDYNKMQAVIRTKIGSKDSCYLTRINPTEMGSYEDFKQKVIDAKKNDGLVSPLLNEIEFAGTNITVDASVLGSRGATLCADVPVVWLEAQRHVTSSETGLELRQKRSKPKSGGACKKDVVVVVIIIVVREKPAAKC